MEQGKSEGEAFLERLARARQDWSFNDSDLSHLLQQPRQTIHSWLAGHVPRGEEVVRECVRRLKLAAKTGAFPVPYSITARYRKTYILGVLGDATNVGLPGPGASKKRPALRGGA